MSSVWSTINKGRFDDAFFCHLRTFKIYFNFEFVNLVPIKGDVPDRFLGSAVACSVSLSSN